MYVPPARVACAWVVTIHPLILPSIQGHDGLSGARGPPGDQGPIVSAASPDIIWDCCCNNRSCLYLRKLSLFRVHKDLLV